ncbi:hypothetical protein DPMN_129621 [Dreissena polymorpha]|uniref:Uncharacterized protein n=1 Tax=Dreissena polymorpha TaxID=45954 RepID=A0A9D4H633_DREPO|nr:hypothetical protein DPMN_129621 [Dreissena polymorpha]
MTLAPSVANETKRDISIPDSITVNDANNGMFTAIKDAYVTYGLSDWIPVLDIANA